MGSQRPPAQDILPLSEKTKAWRTGVMKVMQKHLVNDVPNLDIIEQYIYATRPAPRACFSFLWATLLDYLVEQKEQSAVEALVSYYLEVEGQCIDGSWRASFDRMIPGQAGGSQAQESFHGCRLRPALGPRDQSLKDLLHNLENLLRSRARELERGPSHFYAIPGMVWDRDLIEGLLLFLM